jgi:hypothetical protein
MDLFKVVNWVVERDHTAVIAKRVLTATFPGGVEAHIA